MMGETLLHLRTDPWKQRSSARNVSLCRAACANPFCPSSKLCYLERPSCRIGRAL